MSTENTARPRSKAWEHLTVEIAELEAKVHLAEANIKSHSDPKLEKDKIDMWKRLTAAKEKAQQALKEDGQGTCGAAETKGKMWEWI